MKPQNINEAIIDAIRKAEASAPAASGYGNDFLDDVLDGKPFMHVDTPAFRRALRERRRERARSER